jgi:surface antigen
VVACGDRKACRQPLYSGTGRLRLSRLCHGLARLLAICGALAAAGCSYQLETVFSRNDSEVEQTASAERPGQKLTNTTAVPETDLAYARAVVTDALSRATKDNNSIPWENPHTGAGGNITPLAADYSEGTFTCRDFLASYVRGDAQAWLQGEACRTQQGKWEIRSLKPLKQG